MQEFLGHRDFKMTLRYAHLSPDRLREAVTSLEDFAGGSPVQPAAVVPKMFPKRGTLRSGVS